MRPIIYFQEIRITGNRIFPEKSEKTTVFQCLTLWVHIYVVQKNNSLLVIRPKRFNNKDADAIRLNLDIYLCVCFFYIFTEPVHFCKSRTFASLIRK